jgi:hypothetical protein
VTGAAAIEVAWIGELKPKDNATLRFMPVTDARALLKEWQKSPVTSTERAEGEVSLLRLLDLARDPRRMLPGDMKLIGWTDADLGGTFGKALRRLRAVECRRYSKPTLNLSIAPSD